MKTICFQIFRFLPTPKPRLAKYYNKLNLNIQNLIHIYKKFVSLLCYCVVCVSLVEFVCGLFEGPVRCAYFSLIFTLSLAHVPSFSLIKIVHYVFLLLKAKEAAQRAAAAEREAIRKAQEAEREEKERTAKAEQGVFNIFTNIYEFARIVMELSLILRNCC